MRAHASFTITRTHARLHHGNRKAYLRVYIYVYMCRYMPSFSSRTAYIPSRWMMQRVPRAVAQRIRSALSLIHLILHPRNRAFIHT